MTLPLHRRFTRAARAVTVVMCALVSVPVRAAPLRIRLRGSAHIEARTTRAAGKIVVSGAVLDDAGQPIAAQPLAISVTESGVAVGATPGACVSDRPVGTLVTDDLGTFCARYELSGGPYILHVTSAATPLFDAATSDLRVDVARRSLALVFDPRPRVIALDEPHAVVDVLARFEDEGAATEASGLALLLTDEGGTRLGRVVTTSTGRARFHVDTTKLASPGRGELRVSYPGDAETAAVTVGADVERHARVTLTLAASVAEGDPEEGVTLPVAASVTGRDPPGGSIEAFVGGMRVGAAPLVRGRADLVVTFGRPALETRQVQARLRYAPDAPWHAPSADLLIDVPLRPPSPWTGAPWLLGAAGVIAWLTFARLRRVQAARPTRETTPRARTPEATLEVVRAANDPSVGWTGHVLDAHDGVPIANAELTLERGGFQTTDLLATVATGPDGAFTLQANAVREGDLLRVVARFHSELQRVVPPRGELRVALVQRRRALLDRLVAWARARGKPFDAKPEPTPAHVERIARDRTDVPRAAAWAAAVERAAFAGEPIDAQAERVVDALHPD